MASLKELGPFRLPLDRRKLFEGSDALNARFRVTVL
jgi:hypothetical protein